jgi:anti-anti-sigma factor
MTYRHFCVERYEAVCCLRLRRSFFGEAELIELEKEVAQLIDAGGRQLVLSLAGLDGLYSVFMGKLLAIRQRLLKCGGTLTLCDAAPHVVEVFDVCRLTPYFQFAKDQAAAVAALTATP